MVWFVVVTIRQSCSDFYIGVCSGMNRQGQSLSNELNSLRGIKKERQDIFVSQGDEKLRVVSMPPSEANGYPFYSWAGLRVVEATEGRSTIELDVQLHHRGGGGTEAVNGGIVAYMFDGLLGSAVRSIWTEDILTQVTITLNIQYLRLLKAKTQVVGKARVIRQGSTTVFAEGEILDESETVCAKCTGIYRLFRKSGHEAH